MENNTILEQMRSANNLFDAFAFCKTLYQILSEQKPSERAQTLAWFFQQAHDHDGYTKDRFIFSEDLSDQLGDYPAKYAKLVRGLINFFSVKGYTEALYYQNLWDSIEALLSDATQEEKSFCLFEILLHPRTPYYELPASLQIPNKQWGEIIDSINISIRQLDFAAELSKDERLRTEFTSRVVHLLESLDTFEKKAAFLACFMKRVEKLYDERKANKDNRKTGNSAQAVVKSNESVTSEGTSEYTFQPQSIQNGDNEAISGEILAHYEYPNINGDEYVFVLVKKGEEIFLSDQGKTLEKLDKIFELKEPDVKKNLVAILKQYGAINQGNEFVIKIENWDGNTNESEALVKAKLSLFSCVSFMLNMKIFYV